jgi:hypothetical protein
MTLATHLHLVSRIRRRGAIFPFIRTLSRCSNEAPNTAAAELNRVYTSDNQASVTLKDANFLSFLFLFLVPCVMKSELSGTAR